MKTIAGGSELTVTVTPQAAGLSVALSRAGQRHCRARSNYPGVVQRGRWRALYTAIPAERRHVDGVVQDRQRGVPGDERNAILISPRFPGGAGWQSLPAWLPQQNAVWHAEAMWVLRTAER